jgi:hypothetical protein
MVGVVMVAAVVEVRHRRRRATTHSVKLPFDRPASSTAALATSRRPSS